MLANKTLLAIDEALKADQGAKYRGFLGQLMPLAADAYDTKEDDWRNHLGASIIGRECAREIWYSFHWTTLKRFDGRMLRLFNRGHLEEPRLVALLMMIGCKVWQIDENGKQFRIKGHRGHFAGSLDGVALGIPDLPDEPVLTEFKTHNEKSFLKLKEGRVIAAKYEHFVQMQIYMGRNGLRWALYMAVNKNTDEIYAELVQFDPAVCARYEQRSAMIIDSPTPPPKINKSPSWFKCQFCDQKGVCHGEDLPARNCRTCVHSRVADAGQWFCAEATPAAVFGCSDITPLSPETQRLGCDYYHMHPAIKA